ncbi:TPA: hypothetical protein ACT20Q_001799 [Yersinia enterocolitica]|uniref:hypothetical protein n=1 Tax=Yersinia TaxID=629 RepID=UPI0016438B08|nr:MULTISPECIES: hypothetical protein [Yersinia]HDV5953800.1 hypothetical protein [Yersinia enterocolitica]HDW8059632.1 hypothetical protein [Yersinia enterocolitica]
MTCFVGLAGRVVMLLCQAFPPWQDVSWKMRQHYVLQGTAPDHLLIRVGQIRSYQVQWCSDVKNEGISERGGWPLWQNCLKANAHHEVTRTANLGTWGTAWSRTSDDGTSSTSSVV